MFQPTALSLLIREVAKYTWTREGSGTFYVLHWLTV